MILKRILSGVTAAALTAMTLLGAGLSVSAGNATDFPYDDYGITEDDVKISYIRPCLQISRTEITCEEAEVDPIVTVTVSVSGAEGCYSAFGLHIKYDERLKPVEYNNGKYAKIGDAIEDEFFTHEMMLSGSRFFYSGAAVDNFGLDGTLFTMRFEVPSDIEPGDEFPIEFEYNNSESTEDQFIGTPATRESLIMQAWTFTRGLGDGYIRIGGPVKGDCNLDGYVDVRDAALMLNEYTQVQMGLDGSFTEKQKQLADLDGDGWITARDASLVVRDYTDRLIGKGSTVLNLKGSSSYLDENSEYSSLSLEEIEALGLNAKPKLSAELKDDIIELTIEIENVEKTEVAFGLILSYSGELLDDENDILRNLSGLLCTSVDEKNQKIAMSGIAKWGNEKCVIRFALPENIANYTKLGFSMGIPKGGVFTDSELSENGKHMSKYFRNSYASDSIFYISDPNEFPYKLFGTTEEEVENCKKNPCLTIDKVEATPKDVKKKRVQTVNFTLDKGEGYFCTYTGFDFCIRYDDRLKLVPKSNGKYSTADPSLENFYSAGEEYIEDGLFRFSAYRSYYETEDYYYGKLFSLDFAVPDDAEPGDVFPISIEYFRDGKIMSSFSVYADPDMNPALRPQIMNPPEAWLFSRGITNGYIKVVEEEIDPYVYPLDDYDLTAELVENAPVKPTISASKITLTQKQARQFPVIETEISVSGADKSYNDFGFFVSYDPRLTIAADENGCYMTPGNAVSKMLVSDNLVKEGLLYVSGSAVRNAGLDGVIGTISFRVPEDAEAGDEFPIEIKYIGNEEEKCLFTMASNEEASRLMEAWVFTRGLESGCIRIENIKGDCNADDYVDMRDILIVLKEYRNFASGKTDTFAKETDVDGDGRLVAKDVKSIIEDYTQRLAGKESTVLDIKGSLYLENNISGGFTSSEIEDAPVKPVLNMSAEKNDGFIDLTLNVGNTGNNKISFGLVLDHDKRLTLLSSIDDIAGINSCLNSGCAFVNEDMHRIALTAVDQSWADGQCITMRFALPDDYSESDVYKFCIDYSAGSAFTDIDCSKNGRLMQAYFFSNLPVKTSVRLGESAESDLDYIIRTDAGSSSKYIVITKYNGTSENVVIPSEIEDLPVRVIGEKAFSGNTTMRTVEIPDGITEISENAFRSCISLSSVIIPGSILKIDAGAFAACTRLKTVKIRESNSTIADNAFAGCTALSSITLPWGVYSIGKTCFAQCPENFEIIGYNGSYAESYAEENNIRFRDINTVGYEYNILYDDNIEITNYSGENKNIFIPLEISGYNVIRIADNAFKGNEVIEYVSIPNSVTSIGKNAFYGCPSLGQVSVSENVTSIGTEAFAMCPKLMSVKLPDSLTKISDGMFNGCSDLAFIDISKNAASIGSSAFSGCSSIKSLVIPEGVAKIGDDCFKNCSKDFTIIGYTGTCSETYANENGIKFIGISEGDPYIDYFILDDYTLMITKYIGKDDNCVIPSEINGYMVTKIASDAFAGSGFKTLTIPEGITDINTCAFADCTNLTTVVLPNTITYIDQGTFSRCTKLKSITIPNGVRSIGYAAFNGCTSLTDVVISKTVEAITEYSFGECTSLTSIVIPEGVEEIYNYAFKGCENLTEITISESVKNIGDKAFEGCPGLTIKGVPGSYAESYAKKNGITFTGISEDESDIKYVVDENGNIELTKYICKDDVCSVPAKIDGHKVVAIGGYAFSGSESRKIVLPDSVKTINEGAFKDCTGLKELTIPESVSYISEDAFQGCDKLTIKGVSGSYAETYAKENGIAFDAPETAAVYGDIDGDGKVSAYDASLVLTEYTMRGANKPSVITDEQAVYADIDGDGKISAYDASLILSFYTYRAGKGTETDILKWFEAQSK